jgi:hypothetical protein
MVLRVKAAQAGCQQIFAVVGGNDDTGVQVVSSEIKYFHEASFVKTLRRWRLTSAYFSKTYFFAILGIQIIMYITCQYPGC